MAASSFYEVNAFSTRQGSVTITRDDYYGPSFSGFENLEVKIASDGNVDT